MRHLISTGYLSLESRESAPMVAIALLPTLRNLEGPGLLPHANHVLNYVVAEALHRAGLIDRHASNDYAKEIERNNLEPLTHNATYNLLRSLSHGERRSRPTRAPHRVRLQGGIRCDCKINSRSFCGLGQR